MSDQSPRSSPSSTFPAVSAEELTTPQLAVRVIHSLYRLIKGCLLHEESNQAVAQLVDFAKDTVVAYCDKSGAGFASVLFAAKTVFVNRQMLRASRETYALALELGQLVEAAGVNEITVTRDVKKDDLAELGKLLAAIQRDRKLAAGLDEGKSLGGVRLRRVTGFGAGSDESPIARAARIYAACIMLVRTFHNDLREDKYESPQGIKRASQRLASLSEEDARLLLVVATTPSPEVDAAMNAVSTGVLAVAIARQLTEDRTALASLAAAALMFDCGRHRLLADSASATGRVVRELDATERERMPESTLVAMTRLGKLHPPALARAVIAYEAHCLARPEGIAYGGRRTVSLLARALHVARGFVSMRAQKRGQSSASIDDALQMLAGEARDNTERTFVKLLQGALGIFPAGTMVELDTGELAVVTATPELPVDFARPPVRILYDRDATLLDEPIDLDLSKLAPRGEPTRNIVKPVDADEQQLKQMRAYVAGLSAARRGRRPLQAPGPSLPQANAPAASVARKAGRPETTGPAQADRARAASAATGSLKAQRSREDTLPPGEDSASAPVPLDLQLDDLGDLGDLELGAGHELSEGEPVADELAGSRSASSSSASRSSAPPLGGLRGLTVPGGLKAPARTSNARAPVTVPSRTSSSVPPAKQRRPVVRRRDPRAEEDDPPVLPEPERIVPVANPAALSGATRELSWDERGAMLRAQQETSKDDDEPLVAPFRPEAVSPEAYTNPTPSRPLPAQTGELNDTDALLAAFLNDSDPEPEPEPERTSAPPSGGLRWRDGGPPSSGRHAPPSSGSAKSRERQIGREHAPSTGGLRWNVKRKPGDE